MYAHGEACCPDQGREDTGAYCPLSSVVRESCDCIIGDAPPEAIPFGRLYIVSDSLRQPAYTVIVEGMMSTGQSSAKPAGLSQLNLNAAGIDVGSTSHYVAVPADRTEQPVQEFEAFTADLYRLADWLAECGVETVVMESTGVYWIPLFGVLEERGFEVMLVDPRRIKNVPGRKTDVLDCQDDCKVSELDRRAGRWSALGGRRKSWLAGAWISGLETILPGAGRSDRC